MHGCVWNELENEEDRGGDGDQVSTRLKNATTVKFDHLIETSTEEREVERNLLESHLNDMGPDKGPITRTSSFCDMGDAESTST